MLAKSLFDGFRAVGRDTVEGIVSRGIVSGEAADTFGGF